MGFRLAKTTAEKLEIMRLCYQCYVEEMHWRPEPTNPSHFRVVEHPEGSYLDDDFSQEATYFSFWENGVLVAGGRYLLGAFSQLELSRYGHNMETMPSSPHLAEINRTCLRQSHLQSSVLPMMLQTVLQHLEQKQLCEQVLTSVAFPNPGDLFCKLGFTVESPFFTYGKTDFQPVKVISLNLKDSSKLQKITNIIGNLYGLPE